MKYWLMKSEPDVYSIDTLAKDKTTWWEARQRVAAGAVPDPSGPQVAQWRRVWEQTESPVAEARTRRLAAWRR